MKKTINVQLTESEAVFLIGFKALPRSLTLKLVDAIQADSEKAAQPEKKTRRAKQPEQPKAEDPQPALN